MTLSRATVGDTIDAAAANTTIYPLDKFRIQVNAATNGFLTTRKQNNPEKYAVASGTNTYTASLDPVPLAYVTGTQYLISFTNANTSTIPTLNLNSLGAKTIVKNGSGALVVGDIPVNHKAILIYDGTNAVLQNPVQPSFARALFNTGSQTTGSAVLIDMPGATVTLTTGANPVHVSFAGTIYNSVGASLAHLNIDIDGILQFGTSGRAVYFPAANQEQNANLTIDTAVLTAGSHTVKIQWMTNAGTIVINGSTVNPFILSVHEISS